MADDYNSVPLGQAGTGAAFLLGGSKALDNWMKQDQRNAQVRSANTLAQQKFDQGVGKSYATNAFKGVPGQMWNAELKSKIDEHTKQGAQYLAQGIDIYNPNYRDPQQLQAHNAYMQDRSVLNNMLNLQKEYEKDATDQDKLLKADPYAFTQESVQAKNDFEKGTTLYDAATNGVKYPSLEKVFDYNKNVTEQIPVLTTEKEETVGNERVTRKDANVPAITGFAKKLLESGQNRNWVEKQIGGNLDGLLYETDPDKVKKSLDAEFRSPTGVEMMAELRNKGKVPAYGTPQYDKFLDDATKEQLKAENKYDQILSSAVQDGIAKANPSYKKVNDFSLASEARAQRAEARSIEDQSMQRTKFKERGSSGSSVGNAEPINIPFANGKASVTLPEYVPISISKKNFAGSPSIDLATGKEGSKLPSSNDYEVVGVGNAPFIKSGDLKGSISQPEYAERRADNIEHKPIVHVQIPAKGEFGKAKDYFIPYDRLPENVKNSKQVKEALSKFKPASSQSQPTVVQPEVTPKSTGMVRLTLPNGQSGELPADKVADFLKKYPKAKRQ